MSAPLQPRRVGGRVGVARYDLAYELAGAAGDLLVQEVRAAIVCFADDEPVVCYHAVYGEWFRLGDGPPVLDRHHFALRRDGWSRESIEALLRRASPGGRLARRPGALRIEYRKRFLLGRGALEGGLPARQLEAGAAFGLLERGPLEAAGGTLELRAPGGRTLVEALRCPYPSGAPAAGRGVFVGGRVQRADERFTWVEGAERASLVERGYEEAELPEPRAPGGPLM
ncbi:MAG: hypothetical protein R3A51_02160 [Nannocystaceae bacterium]